MLESFEQERKIVQTRKEDRSNDIRYLIRTNIERDGFYKKKILFQSSLEASFEREGILVQTSLVFVRTSGNIFG